MDETTSAAMLTLARKTIESHLRGTPLPELPAVPDADMQSGGVFVTLHNAGRLRGCIGRFNPDAGVAATVQDMAVAVLGDPRFQHVPVRLEEVPQLHIEISVLSKMERTADPLSLQLGVHGIYIRRGHRAGCFLPQVSVEQGWDREMFLSHCCADKAGLPADAWKDPRTEVCLFTSTVIEE